MMCVKNKNLKNGFAYNLIFSLIYTYNGKDYMDGLRQKRRNSIANALGLCLFCIKSSIYIDEMVN